MVMLGSTQKDYSSSSLLHSLEFSYSHPSYQEAPPDALQYHESMWDIDAGTAQAGLNLSR